MPTQRAARPRLGSRLLELRTKHWPGTRLTQTALGAALGGAEPLSGPTVSTYESGRGSPPTDERLACYATFFCTHRSVEGPEPRMLAEEELTDSERDIRDQLLAELTTLRDSALRQIDPSLDPTLTRRFLRFAEHAPVTILCAQLPETDRPPSADPKSLTYAELYSYADLDSVVELFGHLRAENPASEIRFRISSQVLREDFSNHLVLTGGIAWNTLVDPLINQLELPIRQRRGEKDESDVFETHGDVPSHRFEPRFSDNGQLIEDVGMLAWARNPNNSSRTVTIFNGVWSHGVFGATRALTHAPVRDANEEYLRTRFRDVDAFVVLMRVMVVGGIAVTPDLRVPRTRLFEWPAASA